MDTVSIYILCDLSWCFLRKAPLCSQHFVHEMNDKSEHHYPQCSLRAEVATIVASGRKNLAA